MNVKELREYLDELEQGWDEDVLGSFDLVPVYYRTMPSNKYGDMLVNSDFEFDYVSNSIIVGC